MPLVNAEIPKSLRLALDEEISRLRTDESAVLTAALSRYLAIPVPPQWLAASGDLRG
jgi:hypothetical protein